MVPGWKKAAFEGRWRQVDVRGGEETCMWRKVPELGQQDWQRSTWRGESTCRNRCRPRRTCSLRGWLLFFCITVALRSLSLSFLYFFPICAFFFPLRNQFILFYFIWSQCPFLPGLNSICSAEGCACPRFFNRFNRSNNYFLYKLISKYIFYF